MNYHSAIHAGVNSTPIAVSTRRGKLTAISSARTDIAAYKPTRIAGNIVRHIILIGPCNSAVYCYRN